MSEEPDKARSCAVKLRDSASASNGAKVARRLENEAKRYRAKLDRREGASD